MQAHTPDLIIRTLQTYGNKAAREVARVAIENQTGIDELNHAASSKNKRLKNAAIKTLRLISEDAPELTYFFTYYYDFLLDSEDQILKWNATFIICNHAVIDKENKITEQIVEKLLRQIQDKVLITAANTTSCIWKIAKYKPEYRSRILKALLKADMTSLDDECKEILSGKAIDAFRELQPDKKELKLVLEFINRHVNSQRPATAKKAEKFLKKFEKAG